MSDQQADKTVDAQELKLVEQTMAKVLAGIEGRELLDELDELGWFELWRERPGVAARALFGQQGRLARTSPTLTVLMGAALWRGLAPPEAAISSGTTAPPVLLPEPRAFDRERRCTPGPDGTLTALAQADALEGATHALLVLGGPPQTDTHLLRVQVAALRRTPVQGLDPSMRLCAVDATKAAHAATSLPPLASGEKATRAWVEALALGRRLLAEEMLGVVAEQLRLALDHAASRTQFDRAIGSFQAVKHKLAEVYVALTVAELATDEAWTDPAPTASLLAKVLAGAAVDTANLHCQQVLGGIGFTWEYPFHHYLRRGRLLAALLGSRVQLSSALGADILNARAAPELAAL